MFMINHYWDGCGSIYYYPKIIVYILEMEAEVSNNEWVKYSEVPEGGR